MAMKEEIDVEKFTDDAGGPRLRIRSRNGKILASSEAYSSRGERDDTVSLLERCFREPTDVQVSECAIQP